MERARSDFQRDPRAATDRKLEQYRAEHLAGNNGVLPIAIRVCGHMGRPLPDWLVDAWAEACNAVHNGDVRGWDDILSDQPLRSEAARLRFQRKARLIRKLLAVLEEIGDAYMTDVALFTLVSQRLNVSRKAAEHLYYRDLPERARLTRKSKPTPKTRV